VVAGVESSLELHSVETESCRRSTMRLVDVLSIDLTVVSKGEGHFLAKPVDDEVKQLALVDFTVCLLLFDRHTCSKQSLN
jgi:hypothetical protein